jgi:outer membrane receptor protein involved in Fe transport
MTRKVTVCQHFKECIGLLLRQIMALRSLLIIWIITLCSNALWAQEKKTDPGIIAGNILDGNKKGLEGASIELISLADSLQKRTTLSDKSGNFSIEYIAFGSYKLRISYVGLQSRIIDSIHFRTERFDFNLADITLNPKTSGDLEEVIVYSEKPLIQSKDGNITFNAGESAIAAGSNASELLNNVPLVTKDPTGKILVRGKEPKILIDDKPVELNLQQLQDLLESLPGSSIEKIEVMTNPPPQYANEQGGVINIVTKKGKVGRSGRINLSGGTRGEASIGGNFSYRKQGLAISINAGAGYNRFEGSGYSTRTNMYVDSSSVLKTKHNSLNKNTRPNFRFNLDYDLSKLQSINLVLNYNENDFNNRNATEYTNINRYNDIYRISERTIRSEGESFSPNLNLTYTVKSKTAGEQLKIITGINYSNNENERDFYQQYFNPDHTPNGIDSTQKQITKNKSNGLNFRVNYDKPLANKKTFISLGSFYNRSNSHITTDASYLKKPEMVFLNSDPLSNDFRFHQDVFNLRASLKQNMEKRFSISAGLSAEMTKVEFDLIKDNNSVINDYWTLLPFGNINKIWSNDLNLTFSYRRTIRRPGINEQNPSIDFSDPYNTRFGNPRLKASTAHNFDLVLGKTKPLYFINTGFGYNVVEDIFSQVRTLIPGEKTEITWENISGRNEYEISSWNGFTITKKLKLNLSASYIYNVYSAFDRNVNRYRNGGSFTSNINSTYTPKDIWNLTGSFTFNRFANPQGYARWNLSMNLGVQRKFFEKRFIVTVNMIDPFVQQKIRNLTYGSKFFFESYNTTQTRNFRLTMAWNFNSRVKKKIPKPLNKK